jgi:hypothetical protein
MHVLIVVHTCELNVVQSDHAGTQFLVAWDCMYEYVVYVCTM